MYNIDPAVWGGVFVLPDRLRQELKLCSGSFLKALAFVFMNAGVPADAEAVAAGTGLSPGDAADALRYWEERGFLRDAESAPVAADAPAPAAAPAASAEKEPKQTVNVKPVKPSYDMICKRIAEDPGVRELFQEAQMKLGRTIGTADQASLLLLYDYYGLPVEVILAVCEYARLHKKERNMGYIYSVGADWSKREIDTLEAAEEEINRLNALDKNWPEFARVTGIKTAFPTTAQQKFLATWMEDWKFGFDMLALAYDEMMKNTGKVSFPYMNKVLATWRNDGVVTPEDAAAREKRFQEASLAAAAQKHTAKTAAARKSKTESAVPASYDIQKAAEKANTTVPKFKKKEKR